MDNHFKNEFLRIGTWSETIPLEKRFSLCERVLHGKVEYNAIDLVSGYMSQRYWNYWSWGDVAYNFYREDISPILVGSLFSETKLLQCIDGWGPYKVGKSVKFGIVDYEEALDDRFIIHGVGKYKTLSEHQHDLQVESSKWITQN